MNKYVLRVDLILWDLGINRSFWLIPSTYSKFILILIFSSWIYVAYVCCCDWDKLWLLAILLKVLLIILSWYPLLFNTSFILASSLVKLSLFMIIEYALFKQGGNNTFLATCLVVVAVVYVLVSMHRLPICQYRDLPIILFQ